MLKKLNNNPSLLSRKEEAQALAGGVQVGGGAFAPFCGPCNPALSSALSSGSGQVEHRQLPSRRTHGRIRYATNRNPSTLLAISLF
jgi:hypothetical protein